MKKGKRLLILLAAAVLFGAGAAWLPMLAAGMLSGAVYEAGYRIRERMGAELGEVFFGFLIGAALVAGVG